MLPIAMIMRRRRRSAAQVWTPAQIPTSLWLDASDAGTITLNGANVSQWNDKSGNAKNATQTNAAYQVPYSATGLNGKPALMWPNSANPRSIGTPSLQAITFFFALAYADGTQATWIAGNQGVFGDAAGVQTGLIGTSIGGNAWSNGNAYQFIRRNGGAEVSTNTSTIQALPLSPSVLQATRNGALTIGWNIGMNRNLNTLNRGWSGPIGEVIALAATPTTATRQLIEGYLAWKWGGF